MHTTVAFAEPDASAQPDASAPSEPDASAKPDAASEPVTFSVAWPSLDAHLDTDVGSGDHLGAPRTRNQARNGLHGKQRDPSGARDDRVPDGRSRCALVDTSTLAQGDIVRNGMVTDRHAFATKRRAQTERWWALGRVSTLGQVPPDDQCPICEPIGVRRGD